jgi:hypothetical protein
MSGSQLPLFQRKTYKGIIPTIPLEMQAPGADKTVLETLPAYYTYLQNGIVCPSLADKSNRPLPNPLCGVNQGVMTS